MVDLFADSFGLVAFLEGNPRYVRIFHRKRIATTSLNLLELYSTLRRRLDARDAKAFAAAFLPIVVSPPPEIAFAAGDFRVSMRARKRDCSYVDAWGYATAAHLGVRFLTGDPAFKGEENVEFVR